jgi:hypothetical protein
MGKAAADEVRAEFSQEKAIERLEGFYDEAIELGKAPAANPQTVS